MSCVERDMIEDHESTARAIQEFMWEGKPFKSTKKEHTVEEFESFLESLRQSAWDSYDTGAEAMGWVEKREVFKVDTITGKPPKPKPKVKEVLLEKGTKVMINNDDTKAIREIVGSISDEDGSHRYFVSDWSYVCGYHDFSMIMSIGSL